MAEPVVRCAGEGELPSYQTDGASGADLRACIDGDYRGEVKVILVNLGAAAYRVTRGDRIAQLVIAPVVRASYERATDIEDTGRGGGGFGSTGV